MIRRSAAAALLTLIALGLAAPAARSQAPLPIELDADSSDLDRKNGRWVFAGMRVTQGDLSVRSDQASSTDVDLTFDDTSWVLEGNVVIRSGATQVRAARVQLHFDAKALRAATLTGQPVRLDVSGERAMRLSAGRAELEFGNGRLGNIRVFGQPVDFERADPDSAKILRGRADQISYNSVDATLEFRTNAWLSDGDSELTGDTISYDIVGERVIASAGGEQRVRIVIQPDAVDANEQPADSAIDSPAPRGDLPAPDPESAEPQATPEAPR